MQENTSHITRITINKPNDNPLSYDESLSYLLISLDDSYLLYGREFLQSLCEIAIELYKDADVTKANKNLRKKYTLPNLKLPPVIAPDGTKNLLYTTHAVRLLSLLLSCNCTLNFSPFPRGITGQDPRSLQYRIVEAFLFANQLLTYLDRDMDEISYYYNNTVRNPVHIIARSRIIYTTSYFNQKMKQNLGMSSTEFNNFLFVQFTHVYAHSPAKIEPDTNFRKFFKEDKIKKFKKILQELAKVPKNEPMSYQELRDNLPNYYIQDKLKNKIYRGKPFWNVNNRFICIRPDLLTDAFDTYPYFYLLNRLSDKEKLELWHEFGEAFEKYFEILSKRVFGNNSIKPAKKNESDPCADQIIVIKPAIHVLIELKGSKETDLAKLGSRKELRKKFITLTSNTKEEQRQGVVQLFKSTKKYREDTNFEGVIYTIIVFFGDFPKTPSFDELIKSEISSIKCYEEYQKNKKNRPTIWLSAHYMDLIFSLVVQGGSFEEMLKDLSETPSCNAGDVLIKYAKENNLKISLRPLFEKELQDLNKNCLNLYKEI